MIRNTGDLCEVSEAAIKAMRSASTAACRIAESTATPLILWDRAEDSVRRVPSPSPLLESRDAVVLECEHREWLQSYGTGPLEAWEDLRSNNYEAALTEAGVRRFLQQAGVEVEPNRRVNEFNRSPDFVCRSQGNGFYVEVTSISIDDAATATGIPFVPRRGLNPASLMTKQVRNKCCEKTTQLANLDAPALLVIGCFHQAAADVAFSDVAVAQVVTGESSAANDIVIGDSVTIGNTYFSTELLHSSVLRPSDSEEIEAVRRTISALLFVKFYVNQPKAVGIIHPDAIRPFDAKLLPAVRFGVAGRDADSVTVTWPSDID